MKCDDIVGPYSRLSFCPGSAALGAAVSSTKVRFGVSGVEVASEYSLARVPMVMGDRCSDIVVPISSSYVEGADAVVTWNEYGTGVN